MPIGENDKYMLLKSKNCVYRLSFLADFYSRMFQNNTNTHNTHDDDAGDDDDDDDDAGGDDSDSAMPEENDVSDVVVDQ